METFVLYLYRSIIGNYPKEDHLMKIGTGYPLIAIIQNKLDTVTLSEQIKRFNLQPFEIQQKNYDTVLLNAENMNVRILDIQFDELIDPDVKHELVQALNSSKYEVASTLLGEIREENDIATVSFLFKGRDYKVSKYGVVELDGEYQELENLTATTPVAVITGMKKWSPETLFYS